MPSLDPVLPKMRVLCLHGFGQSAATFRQKTGALRKELGKQFDFVFTDAPYRIPCAADEDFGRMWWERTDHAVNESGSSTSLVAPSAADDGVKCCGWIRSLHYLLNVWNTDGPFTGILAFSQGAAMAGILLTVLASGAGGVCGPLEDKQLSWEVDRDPDGVWAVGRIRSWAQKASAAPSAPPDSKMDRASSIPCAAPQMCLDVTSEYFNSGAWKVCDIPPSAGSGGVSGSVASLPSFAVLVSGFLIRDIYARRALHYGPLSCAEPRSSAVADALAEFNGRDSSVPPRCRVLHVSGLQDAVIDPCMTSAMGLALASHTRSFDWMEHGGGHGVPQRKEERAGIVSFVRNAVSA